MGGHAKSVIACPVIAVTTGEPAGIGPEICAVLSRKRLSAELIFIGDRDLLVARGMARSVAQTRVLHVPLRAQVLPGKLDARNARYVLDTLDAAIDGAISARFAAMVTAPVQKSIINEAGVPFMGHTEYLEEKSGSQQVVMMLAGHDRTVRRPLRVALATTHHALADVASVLTAARLETTLRVLHDALKTRFWIASPAILVAGLNPHAGESGHLGREEIEIITPVVQKLRGEGMQLTGPLPADTLFTPKYLRQADAVLAMYHDQGLPVLKYATFGAGVNITLGLPFIRTSVDHGTALDLAGKGLADAGSLIEATQIAIAMAHNFSAGVAVAAAASANRRLRESSG